MTRAIYSSPVLNIGADTNYSALSDAYDGTAVKVVPTSLQISQGVRPHKQSPAQFRNYYDNQIAQILSGLIADVEDVEMLPALNWNPLITTSVPLVTLAWSEFEQSWFATQAGNVSARRSLDYGKTWDSITIPTNATAFDVAADPAGNIVIACAGAFQTGTYVSWGSMTWASHTVSNLFTVNAQIVYEPGSSLWCSIGTISASFSIIIWTSPDGATWTNRTVPTNWHNPLNLTGATVAAVYMGVGNGVIVACFIQTAAAFRTMRSLDGGITWANDQQITVDAGITLSGASVGFPNITRPLWSAADGLWYIAVNQLSGSAKSQVFSSPDAITWTSVATLLTNDVAINALQCIGSLLVGLNDGTRVVISGDKGVTWYRAGAIYSGGASPQLRAGGSGLLAMFSGGFSISSLRSGHPITLA